MDNFSTKLVTKNANNIRNPQVFFKSQGAPLFKICHNLKLSAACVTIRNFKIHQK